ncbi:MAG: hypothetical protein ACO3UN_06915 [Candidatus Puniceispirillaceae bacterium]
MKTEKVKFLKNATGSFNLCYGPGDVVDIEAKQAELLVEAGIAEIVAEPEPKPKAKAKK